MTIVSSAKTTIVSSAKTTFVINAKKTNVSSKMYIDDYWQ